MATFEFQITEVFDIRGRGGLLVVGTVLGGAADPGTVLCDATTGHSFGLLGIDLICRRGDRRGAFALVVSRSERPYAQPGRRWVAARPDEDG